jgi:D-mannonate dehydratase
VLEIAEFISPAPSPVWKLALQAGVNLAVGGLPFDDLQAGEGLTDYAPLLRMQQRYEAAGFALRVIEARPPLNKAKRGLPGRDEEIDTVCTLIENMGKLGVGVWCYEWMTDFNWVRTNLATPSRGGSVVTSFDINDVTADLTRRRSGSICNTSSNASCRSPRRRRSSSPCTRTIPRSRPLPGSGASCAASRTTSACCNWSPAR